jgi:hypothetical protein
MKLKSILICLIINLITSQPNVFIAFINRNPGKEELNCQLLDGSKPLKAPLMMVMEGKVPIYFCGPITGEAEKCYSHLQGQRYAFAYFGSTTRLQKTKENIIHLNGEAVLGKDNDPILYCMSVIPKPVVKHEKGIIKQYYEKEKISIQKLITTLKKVINDRTKTIIHLQNTLRDLFKSAGGNENEQVKPWEINNQTLSQLELEEKELSSDLDNTDDRKQTTYVDVFSSPKVNINDEMERYQEWLDKKVKDQITDYIGLKDLKFQAKIVDERIQSLEKQLNALKMRFK